MPKPAGYWKDIQKVVKELKPICELLGEFPSYKYLRENKRNDILNAIDRHHSKETVMKELGFTYNPKETRGFWKDINNIKKEVLPICEELGFFPNTTELISRGRNDIVNALQKHHSSQTVAEKTGYKYEVRKERGYWEDFDNLKKELLPICEEIGHFPSHEELVSRGRSDILNVFQKYHDKYETALRLGYEINFKEKKGYWLEVSNIVKEAYNIFERHGELPPTDELNELGYESFIYAVSEVYGGMKKLRKDLDMGLSEERYPLYRNEDKLLSEIKTIVEENGGFLPTRTYFERIGRTELTVAIRNYHGGMKEFAEKFGFKYETFHSKNEHLKDEENIKKEFQLLINGLGYFPTSQELIVMDKRHLVYYVKNYHGGFKKFSQTMGYHLSKRYILAEDGHFCDSGWERLVDNTLFKNKVHHLRDEEIKIGSITAVPDFIIGNILIEVLMADYRDPRDTELHSAYIKRYLKKRKAYLLSKEYVLYEIFPSTFKSSKGFKKEMNNLMSFINVNSKQTVNYQFDEDDIGYLDYYNYTKGRGYWKNFDNLESELRPICEQLNCFPTHTELKEMGRTDISSAITSHYPSTRWVAERMNVLYKVRKPIGFWSDISNIISELEPICCDIGKFPSLSYLRNIGRNDIVNAFKNYHPVETVKSKMGYE
ncbi:hypothetical protein [Rossellomorea sp. NRS-1567]|uniref:hypothetical protein n=1 Tax=Rossellomorea sp. NRS-1567 TaxID=3233901 RepID=UPI003D2ACED5